MLDRALENTFPASDPFSIGDPTGTEPPRRPLDRRPPEIDLGRVESLAKEVPLQR